MKPFDSPKGKLYFFAYAAVLFCLAIAITQEKYLFFIAVLLIAAFFTININLQFTICALTLFYPFFFPLGPINQLSLFLITVPLFFTSMLFLMLRNSHKLATKNSLIFIIALSILLVWAFIGYHNNSFSLFSLDLYDSESKLILRSYLAILAGIMTFFCSQWYFSLKPYDEDKILRVIIYSALTIGVVRVLGYFSNFDIPFLGADFRTPDEELRLTPISGRIGGSDIYITLGITSLIAYSFKRVSTSKIILFIVFFMLSILGGGRTVLAALMLSFTLYLAVFYRKYLFPFLIVCILLFSLFYGATEYIPTMGKEARVARIGGSLGKQDELRLITYQYYWDTFLKNPLFGKGIGSYKGRVTEHPDWVLTELRDGGHGAYLSMLCIFGIGGIIFISIMIFGGIIKTYRFLSQNNLIKLSFPYQRLLLFIMLFLTTKAFYFVFCETGYMSITVYFVVGMLVGLLAKTKIESQYPLTASTI